jgi:hypothetical protein
MQPDHQRNRVIPERLPGGVALSAAITAFGLSAPTSTACLALHCGRECICDFCVDRGPSWLCVEKDELGIIPHRTYQSVQPRSRTENKSLIDSAAPKE